MYSTPNVKNLKMDFSKTVDTAELERSAEKVMNGVSTDSKSYVHVETRSEAKKMASKATEAIKNLDDAMGKYNELYSLYKKELRCNNELREKWQYSKNIAAVIGQLSKLDIAATKKTTVTVQNANSVERMPKENNMPRKENVDIDDVNCVLGIPSASQQYVNVDEKRASLRVAKVVKSTITSLKAFPKDYEELWLELFELSKESEALANDILRAQERLAGIHALATLPLTATHTSTVNSSNVARNLEQTAFNSCM